MVWSTILDLAIVVDSSDVQYYLLCAVNNIAFFVLFKLVSLGFLVRVLGKKKK